MADEHGGPKQIGALHRRYKRSGLRRFMRRRRDASFYHLARAVLVPVRALSLPNALAMADRLGDVGYRAIPFLRRLALDHLALALGETHSVAEREEIARAAYRNEARNVVELAKLDEIRARFDQYVSIEGWEHVETLTSAGRGAIVVSGHIGNVDLLDTYVAHRGVPIAAIARRLDDPRLNQLLQDARSITGVQIILRNSPNAAAEILRVLKGGGAFAMQIDQDIRVPSVSVPFFGRLARTPAAAALFAVRRDMAIVVGFARRRPEGGHHFTILPPLYPPRSGDLRRDVVELTTQCSRMLEDHIRAYPAEWNWWHRRWRRPPVPRLDLDAEVQRSRPRRERSRLAG